MTEQAQYCPRCLSKYDGHPALSRTDNQTDICPACGLLEAFESWLDGKPRSKNDWPKPEWREG